jgi:DNA topoisomerase-1
VSHDGVNATLPSDMAPETVTLEQALPLLDARAARGTGKNRKAPSKRSKMLTEANTQPAATHKTKRASKTVKLGEKMASKGKPRKKPAKKKTTDAAAEPAAE